MFFVCCSNSTDIDCCVVGLQLTFGHCRPYWINWNYFKAWNFSFLQIQCEIECNISAICQTHSSSNIPSYNAWNKIIKHLDADSSLAFYSCGNDFLCLSLSFSFFLSLSLSLCLCLCLCLSVSLSSLSLCLSVSLTYRS